MGPMQKLQGWNGHGTPWDPTKTFIFGVVSPIFWGCKTFHSFHWFVWGPRLREEISACVA